MESPGRLVVPVEHREAAAERLGDGQRVLEELALRAQLVLLPRRELRRVDLPDLVAQQIDAARLLRLVGVDLLELPPGGGIGAIGVPVFLQHRLQLTVPVDEAEVLCRGKQLLVVVLAVHVDEVRRDGFEDRGGGGPAVDTAG